jgi:hypothetical protein
MMIKRFKNKSWLNILRTNVNRGNVFEQKLLRAKVVLKRVTQKHRRYRFKIIDSLKNDEIDFIILQNSNVIARMV